jgi:DnaK suppressor protein
MAGTLDIEHYHALLLKRREKLLAVAETADAAADTVELDQTRQGRLSRMDALQQQAMSQESIRRRDLELRRISAALARIESGDYGYCVTCDEEIAPARLEINPAAEQCIKCAEKSAAEPA